MPSTPAQDLQDLRALNARFIHNFVTCDVPSHAAITHPDFVCIGSKGDRQSRMDYLREWATGFHPDEIPYWDVRDEHISLFGNVALVRSTNKYVRHLDGKDVVGMTTYTDTYICRDGQWLCIQAQLTPLSAANYPGDDTIVSCYLRGVKQTLP